MLDLHNKRILFFAPTFFGYEYDIKKRMETAGAVVDMFDERGNNKNIVKALIRLNPHLIRKYIESYYEKVLNTTHSINYDYVFFLKIEAATKKVLEKIRLFHPEAKLYLYEFDSIQNYRHTLELIPLFDKVWSFDRYDCDKYNLNFLPLFYNTEYAEVAAASNTFKYDTLFVGTIHSDRYHYVKAIETQINEYGGTTCSWQYFPSILLYYRMKFRNSYFRQNAKRKDFKFTSISKSDLLSLIGQSRILIDSQHPKQTGLTMRTFEALGARRKLITTNPHVMEYDFYRENNVLIVDRNNPIIPLSFIKAPYEELPNEIYNKYSLSSWLSNIFNN